MFVNGIVLDRLMSETAGLIFKLELWWKRLVVRFFVARLRVSFRHLLPVKNLKIEGIFDSIKIKQKRN